MEASLDENFGEVVEPELFNRGELKIDGGGVTLLVKELEAGGFG